MNMRWILGAFPQYDIITEFDNIEQNGVTQEVHGLKDRTVTKCLFCGTPFEKWNKKDIAHAISECLGNKKLINYCECYYCNHRFGEIAENHLGKFIMPYRFVNIIFGKGKEKNVIKDMPKDNSKSYETYRCEERNNIPVFESETFDVYSMIIEKQGSKIITLTENGFIISLPRQSYDPRMVYISFLKMAYTLMPCNEIKNFIRGIISLYLFVADKPTYYDKNSVWDKTEKEKYINSLPYVGLEICLEKGAIPKGVNVCLLKHTKKNETEPEFLFAIQMKWHTIVIPVLSDNSLSSDVCHFRYASSSHLNINNIRELDFKCEENLFQCNMSAVQTNIPEELYPDLEDDLRKGGLLAKN